jgi:hypothetical protein
MVYVDATPDIGYIENDLIYMKNVPGTIPHNVKNTTALFIAFLKSNHNIKCSVAFFDFGDYYLAEMYDIADGASEELKSILVGNITNLTLIGKPVIYWVGVRVGLAQYQNIVNFYVRSGFFLIGKKSTYITPGGEMLKFPVLSFYKLPYDLQGDDQLDLSKMNGLNGYINKYTDYNDIFNISNQINLAFNLKIYKYSFKITFELVKELKKLLDYDGESSGSFLVVPGTNNLQIDKKTLNYNDNCSVHTIVNKINFHTHPHYCYNKYSSKLGWPSSLDIKYTFQNYINGNFCHLVITREGIYVMQLTLNTQYMLKKLSKNGTKNDEMIIEVISKTILEYFGKYEILRIFQDSQYFDFFITKINSTTLIDLFYQFKSNQLKKIHDHLLNIGVISMNFKMFDVNFLNVNSENYINLQFMDPK